MSLRSRLEAAASRLAPRVPVHVARSEAEREAIYRFRYGIYVEEKNWSVGGVDDHERRVQDDLDDSPYAHHLYVGQGDRIRAAARLLVFPPGDVPTPIADEFSMERIPGIDRLVTSEIGRFCVGSGYRGKAVLPSLANHAYDYLVGTMHADLCFSICRPTMTKYYSRLGARPYGAKLVPTEVGLAIPLVAVLSDLAHFRSVGAITSHRVKRHFGRGKRKPLDQSAFEHLFRESPGLVTDPGSLGPRSLAHESAGTRLDASAAPSGTEAAVR